MDNAQRSSYLFEGSNTEERQRATDNIGKIMRGEQVGLNEYTARKKDGTYSQGALVDITDRVQAEKALLQSS